jgi:sterol desaturase/sphingolipid hydroxylase (fatty acid hydroxylase superfamily)
MEPFYLELAHKWMAIMIGDVLKYASFSIGVWLVLWVALARIMSGRKIRKETPPGSQLRTEFLISLRSVAIFSTISLVPYLLDRGGWLRGPRIAVEWGPWWWAISLLLMILAHDAYFYWSHRLIHDPRLFRSFHRTHHLSRNPSPFSAYSFDPGEAFLMGLFVQLWVILIPTQWSVVGFFVLHQLVRNTIGHCGYELMPADRHGRPLFDWLTATTHHDLHHAEPGWNYGLYFTWWDRWMGTEHPEYLARFAQVIERSSYQTDNHGGQYRNKPRRPQEAG